MSERLKKLYQKGKRLSEDKKWDEMIAVCTEIIKLENDPKKKARAYIGRGFSYYNIGNHDRTIQDFNKAIDLEPQDESIYYVLGQAFQKKEDIVNAIKNYDKAIELNSQYASAYHSRALSYGRMGNYYSAYEDFRNAGNYDKRLKSISPFIYIVSRLDNLPFVVNDPSEFFEFYIKLLFAIEDVKEELFHEAIEGEEIAHYTSLHVLKSLAANEPFRLYNVAYMNDPEEGKTFFELMKKKANIDVQEMFYGNHAENQHFPPAHIGSFVKIDSQEEDQVSLKDKLFLWRTYGKHDNEEATGACLIFDAELFAKNLLSRHIAAMPQFPTSEAGNAGLKSSPQLALYNVRYEQEIIGRDNLSEKLMEIAALLEIINALIYSIDNKKDLISLVQEILDGIRFLFKADHYKEEKEVRIVAMSYYADKEEQLERKIDMKQTPPRFYLEMPDNVRFNEVIFGPKAGNLSKWQQWLTTSVGSVETSTNTPLTIRKSKIKFGGNFQ